MPHGHAHLPIPVAAILTLGFGLSVSGISSAWLAGEESRTRHAVLEHHADAGMNAIRNGLHDAVQPLAMVNRLFATVGNVSRQQFHLFTEPLLQRSPNPQSLTFQRILSAAERALYEAEMRKSHPGFTITEMRAGKLAPAGAKARYRVVDYVAPMAGNETILGFDASSLRIQDHAVDQASRTGRASATPLFRLLQDTGSQRGFAVFMPVYRKRGAAPGDTVSGYTAAEFRSDDLIGTILNRAGLLDIPGIAISVYAGDMQEENLAYRRIVAGSRPDSVLRSFEAAGVHWQMTVSGAANSSTGMHSSSWLVLVAGSLISILLAAYLQSLTNRAAEMTRSLALLKKDIAAREGVEAALRTSEERFHRLADMSTDWYWEQDAQLRFTQISGKSIVDGIPAKEWIGATRRELPVEVTRVGGPADAAERNACVPFTDQEYRIREPNGRMHWITVSGEPLFDGAGILTGYRGTGKDITARKEAELALLQTQTELRELAAHQERVKEDERKRIAREVHDDLGQNLLALRIDVSALDEAATTEQSPHAAQIRAVLAQIDVTMKSVRAIINGLRPSVLDLGLQAAIEWQVAQFTARNKAACTSVIDGNDFDEVLDDERATSVFRIVQESLSNVSRHAFASQVEIRIDRNDGTLFITITDNGVGTLSDNLRKPRSFGLIGIRERVHNLGGKFRIDSVPGKGTILNFSIPLTASCPADAD